MLAAALPQSHACSAQQGESRPLTINNISYTERPDQYSRERCKLDLMLPAGSKDFATLVWFHGGGITSGQKHWPKGFEGEKNLALVAVNYRLSPKIKAHEAIDDAAAAVAWVLKNIEKYGGDKTKVFVAGHSAGAYLSGMVAFAPRYLNAHGLKNTDLAGAILLSGQATTHFQVRKDFGDKDPQMLPKIDEYSIIGNAANKVPPTCLILGDRRIEFPERVEENFLLECVVRKLKSAKIVEIFELQGLDHGTVSSAFQPVAKNFIKRVLAENERVSDRAD